jgi:hypothetical protein
MYNTFESIINTYVQKNKNKKMSLIYIFEYRGRNLEDVVGDEGDIEERLF